MSNEKSTILDEIEHLTAHCWHFERKYGVSTERLAELYEQGRIDDSNTEFREDVTDWVGCHRAWCDRKEQRRALEKDAFASAVRASDKTGLQQAGSFATILGEEVSMIRAILRGGVICPLEDLPESWSDGEPLVVEQADESDEPFDPAVTLREITELAAGITSEDHRRVARAVADHRAEQKRLTREQMGLR